MQQNLYTKQQQLQYFDNNIQMQIFFVESLVKYRLLSEPEIGNLISSAAQPHADNTNTSNGAASNGQNNMVQA